MCPRLVVKAAAHEHSLDFTLDCRIASSANAGRLTSFNEELKILEAQHPNIAVKDLLDTRKALPEEAPFAEKVNQFKNDLVTTEQTWA